MASVQASVKEQCESVFQNHIQWHVGTKTIETILELLSGNCARDVITAEVHHSPTLQLSSPSSSDRLTPASVAAIEFRSSTSSSSLSSHDDEIP